MTRGNTSRKRAIRAAAREQNITYRQAVTEHRAPEAAAAAQWPSTLSGGPAPDGTLRRLASILRPRPGQSLAEWIESAAADMLIGRIHLMWVVGLEPGRAPMRRIRELQQHLPERTIRGFTSATGLGEEELRAMLQTADTPPDAAVDAIAVLIGQAEQQAADIDPTGSARSWSLTLDQDLVAELGGVKAVRAGAATAANRAGWSVRTRGHEQVVQVTAERRLPTDRPHEPVPLPPQPPAPAAVSCGCPADLGPYGICDASARLTGNLSPEMRELIGQTSATSDLRMLPARLRWTVFVANAFAAGTHRVDGFAGSRWLNLDVLRQAGDLGPLASVHVYSTDPYGRYRGKAHGVGCQHMKQITDKHEVITLAELLGLLPEPDDILHLGRSRWDEDRWCSYCGGFLIRRLTAAQCLHYQSLLDQYHQG